MQKEFAAIPAERSVLRADVPPEHRLRQGTNVRAKSQPAAHQPSISLAPETNAGNTSPVD